MRSLATQKAGFRGGGPRLIVDENLSPRLADGLREAGYDARSVAEMGLQGTADPELLRFAEQVDARVLTRDVGHDALGGFGSRSVVVDYRVKSLESVLRLLGGGR